VLKMIITCRRHPTMSRSKFFDHLRNVHWPLIQRYPDVLAAVPGYAQNHSVLPEPGFELSAPYRIAAERDSVIELKFDGVAAIECLLSTPSYQQYVRPDEARFNDLPHNIMVLTEPSNVSRAPAIGRCKRFDFIRRASDTEPSSFGAEINRQSAALALDPIYTGHIDRHVDNIVVGPATDGGFGKGSFNCVREVWATSFDALSAVASRSRVQGVDEKMSFSVFATEFAMQGGFD
jgi:EthD domain